MAENYSWERIENDYIRLLSDLPIGQESAKEGETANLGEARQALPARLEHVPFFSLKCTY